MCIFCRIRPVCIDVHRGEAPIIGCLRADSSVATLGTRSIVGGSHHHLFKATLKTSSDTLPRHRNCGNVLLDLCALAASSVVIQASPFCRVCIHIVHMICITTRVSSTQTMLIRQGDMVAPKARLMASSKGGEMRRHARSFHAISRQHAVSYGSTLLLLLYLQASSTLHFKSH
jgi:hypothetical protein